MSRSFRKVPGWNMVKPKRRNGGNHVNKKIRRLSIDYDLPDGMYFKKLSHEFHPYDDECVRLGIYFSRQECERNEEWCENVHNHTWWGRWFTITKPYKRTPIYKYYMKRSK